MREMQMDLPAESIVERGAVGAKVAGVRQLVEMVLKDNKNSH